ncbi:unnamed protein product [Camellia sinensis]
MSAQKKRNFQIEAFKHRVVVDPKYAEKTWKILEHAIQEIYNHKIGCVLSLSLGSLPPLPCFNHLLFWISSDSLPKQAIVILHWELIKLLYCERYLKMEFKNYCLRRIFWQPATKQYFFMTGHRVSQDMGIDAPIPLSTKLGDFNNVFRRIVTAAERPHLSIPETEAGRSRKQYHKLINRSLMFVSGIDQLIEDESKQEFNGNYSVQVYTVQACIPKYPAALWNAEFVQAEELLRQPSTIDNCFLCHFGYIELPIPVYHPSHVSELKRLLSLVCFKCLKFRSGKVMDMFIEGST